MVLLSNCNLGENIMFTGLLKYFTFTFLIWTYHTYNDLVLYNESIHDNRFILIFNRLLAKQDLQYELPYGNLREKLSVDRLNKNGKNMLGDISTYSAVKRKESNNLDDYMKEYERRYATKKGLFKLDCYWEKNIFDKIEHINIMAEKTHSHKKRFIKKILNKYTIFLFSFALFPYLGFIIPALFGDKKPKNRFMNLYFGKCSGTDEYYSTCDNGVYHVPTEWSYALFYTNYIFIFLSIIAFISIFIYTTVKIIKYEFLKHGLGNITLKEYFRRCKNAF
ncbi:hypothetical protein PVMG_06073 [Plasmodium vivax Mauritania I]|uniref:Variable surface protein n=1 Tax=Plasmodium vivax Mauritania I TaxID=1035515 RepID=A0A0J9T3M1_PLAVI|nr:hypothetical protein PVMG_06073 [Plasmodium vivax Mauritania I]